MLVVASHNSKQSTYGAITLTEVTYESSKTKSAISLNDSDVAILIYHISISSLEMDSEGTLPLCRLGLCILRSMVELAWIQNHSNSWHFRLVIPRFCSRLKDIRNNYANCMLLVYPLCCCV